MKVGRILTITALTIGLGMPAATAYAQDPAAPGADKAKTDPSRRVCRNVVPTGSRMSQRVCRTQAQWDASRDKTQDSVLQHQRTEQTGYRQAGGGL